MINSFSGLETITQGLQMQQLLENITASNLADTSVDANGYLVGSLQQVNVGAGPSQILSTSNGNVSISTGPMVESITRLRSSFLDSQIQQESSVLGLDEILANTSGTGILNQINNIVAGPSTLSGALTTFANDWGKLAAGTGSTTIVVNDGVAFAQLANSQFEQLQNLQQGNSTQINNTVSQINQILQQLSAINKQLLNAQGATNVNSLLDARDYALDRLSRLINIQTNIGVDGTVSVYLGGSSVTLVEQAGVAILQTNVSNPNYPSLLGVTIQAPEGGFYDATVNGQQTPEDMAQWITGGNLGGELQAQNAILSYQEQVDQIATSVMNVTNSFNSSGYGGAAGQTTGIAFFNGTGAADINVNSTLLNNSGLLGASLVPGGLPPVGDPAYGTVNPAYLAQGILFNGTIAEYLSNLPNLLADDFVESDNLVGTGLNPAIPLNSPLQGAFAAPVTGPAGSYFTINGVNITWAPTDSIDDILARINKNVPNVYAVFNSSTSQFFMYSNNPITFGPTQIGNFTTWANIANAVTSTIRMNNYNSPDMPLIDAAEPPPGFPFFGIPGAAPMNSTIAGSVPDTGPNSVAFKVVPSESGVFTINGDTFVWNNTMSLSQIGAMINNPPATYTIDGVVYNNPFPNWNGESAIAFSFDPTTQTVTLTSTQNTSAPPLPPQNYPSQPIQIKDVTGNFTLFTGLNGDTALGNLASGIVNRVSSDTAGAQLLQSQAANSLAQLNAAQANIAGVATTAGQPGVPIANIQQQAVQEMIAYNAMLQVLAVIDQMYSDLVGIISSSIPSGSFQNQSSPV